jgi:hypothetical protein
MRRAVCVLLYLLALGTTSHAAVTGEITARGPGYAVARVEWVR